MRLVGYEEIESKKTGKKFIILHSLDTVDIGRGLGEKTQSDFISPDVVKDFNLKDQIGNDIILSYNRNGFVQSVDFKKGGK